MELNLVLVAPNRDRLLVYIAARRKAIKNLTELEDLMRGEIAVLTLVVPAKDASLQHIVDINRQIIKALGDRAVEFVIVDGSVHGHPEMIDGGYAKVNIRYYHVPGCGIYEAMNYGIEMASGAVIGFMGTTDGVIVDNLPVFFSAFAGKEENISICCPVAIDDEIKSFPSMACFPPIIHHQGFFAARKILCVNKFTTDRFSIHSDFDLMARCVKSSNVIVFGKPVLRFSRGGISTSGKKWIQSVSELSRVLIDSLRARTLKPSPRHIIMLARPIFYKFKAIFGAS